MRTFDPIDAYTAQGRGKVFVGIEPDPPFEVGEEIEILGKAGRIVGLERHPVVLPPQPGDQVGVLLDIWLETRE
jgi:hypothetical protein